MAAVENNGQLSKQLAAVAHFVSLDGVGGDWRHTYVGVVQWSEVILTLVNDGGVDGLWLWLWW